ncbi:alpha/beta fold hydrolase [Pseudomonas sp. S31]|uniref:alpha/beta fold hydrolase n=1 Tax=Pseudomonas sp. S31 TaxID=1564473 RepID=UPI00191461C6|nr:alpha/beta hydrolase [Pseudomonas sp. S31]MBK5002430.1 alpha/beta fold hydrolase [Pseudomonas sp. S31]
MNWLDIHGVALRYQLRRGSGLTLVLLHEMGGSVESWRDVIERLPQSLQVLAYDMRCAGQSEKLVGTMSIDAHCADLAKLLDELAITGPIALAGVAVGAAIAIRYAATHRDQISHVIAMAPACGVAPEAKERAGQAIGQIREQGMRQVFLGLLERGWPEALRTDAERFAAFRGRCLGNDPRGFAHFFEMLSGLNLEDDLASLPTRTVLVAGIYDALRPPAEIQRLGGFAPHVETLDVASGHFMQMQSPRWVARLLADFVCANLSAHLSYRAFMAQADNCLGDAGHAA